MSIGATSATLEGWVSLASFIPKTGTSPPTAIKFPTGEESQIRNWRHLVELAIEWLWRNKLLNDKNLPVRSGNKRYLVHSEPKHPAGNVFKMVVPIHGTRLYIDGNISSIASTSNTKKALNHCGQDPAAVFVKIG